MEFVWKNKNAVVINKEAGVPSQSDPSGDIDAMTMASRKLEEYGEPSKLFLVHRLDRVVGGLMIFARNKATAAALCKLVSGDGIGKEYIAVIDGYLEGGDLSDYLYKDSRIGKSFVTDRARNGVKLAELSFTPLDTRETDNGIKTLVKIKLKTGRFHQIRTQFSSRKAPLTGDGKYGSRDNRSHMPALFAYKLSFELTGEKINVSKLPDTDSYPWSLFDKNIFGELL